MNRDPKTPRPSVVELNAAQDAELESSLRALFDESASVPDPACLTRLTHVAATSSARGTSPRWRHAFALAAAALIAISLGRWTPMQNSNDAGSNPKATTPAEVQSGGEQIVSVSFDEGDSEADDPWLGSDGFDDGLDLLAGPPDASDPAAALELYDTLLAELRKDA